MSTFTQTVAHDLECYAVLVSDTRELHGDRHLYPSLTVPTTLIPIPTLSIQLFQHRLCPHSVPAAAIPVPKCDKHRKVKSERMGSAVGDMKPSFCNSFFGIFHICTLVVRTHVNYCPHYRGFIASSVTTPAVLP